MWKLPVICMGGILFILVAGNISLTVYGKSIENIPQWNNKIINHNALKKAIEYSKMELNEDFGADLKNTKILEEVPLYSPIGNLIYYYVIFEDEKGIPYFSMVSVSYKYAPVICDGEGYGYIKTLKKMEGTVIKRAFQYGILRIPMKAQVHHYVYFGQLNFGYLLSSNYVYMLGFNRFLKPTRLYFHMNGEGITSIKYMWHIVNKTLEDYYHVENWWTKGIINDYSVPYIQWYKGCVPTSIAMIIGYLHNYRYMHFPDIAHIVYSNGYTWISDSNAREVIEFLVNYWELNEENKYGVQWWKIEDGVWAVIRYYGYQPTHNSIYGDIETIYRGGWNRLAWNDYGAIVDGVKRWDMPSFVGLMYSNRYGNHGIVAVGYKYHADWFGWHDKRLYIHDTWYTYSPIGSLYEYHIDGDFNWWNPAAHYDVLNFYPVNR